MYCKNCGNDMSENSNFCNHCGASASRQSFTKTGMTKKEYFTSENCSENAKNMLLANKILLAVLALCIVFTAFTSLKGVNHIIEILNSDEDDIAAIIEKLEQISGESLGLTEVQIDEFMELEGALDGTLGFSVREFLKTSIYVAIGEIIIGSVLILAFAVLAVLKISKGMAITTLVLSVFFSRNWISLAISIALLVLTNKLLSEYNTYSDGNAFYGNINGGNEPYFGA